MKKDLHNDGFEKFLKKSFDGYEESPSSGLWDSIAGDLDTPVSGGGSSGSIFKPLWIGAAAAVIAVGIAAQFFYFQNKIENLTEKVDNQEVKIEKAETEGVKDASIDLENKIEKDAENLVSEPSSGILNTPDSKENSQRNQMKTSGENPSELLIENAKIPDVGLTEVQNENLPDREKKVEFDKNKQVRSDELPSTAKSDGNLSFETVSSNLPAGETESNFLNEKIDNSNDLSSSELVKTTLKELAFLPILNSNIYSSDLPKLPVFQMPNAIAAKRIVPVQNKRKGISFGANGGIYRTSETVTGDIREAGKKGSNNHLIASGDQQRKTSGRTLTAGLELTLDLTDNWSLISGVGFRKDDFQYSTLTSAKFKDLNASQPDPNPNRRKFRYVVNTTGGFYELNPRADLLQGGPIPPNEKIEILTDSRRISEYVTVPLIAKYRRSYGDWNFGLKTGVVANFLLKSELQILSLEFLHPRLMNLKENYPSRKLNRTNKFNLDGMVGIDAAYDLTKNLSLSVQPTTIFGLTEKNDLPGKLNSDFLSFGANIGLNYTF